MACGVSDEEKAPQRRQVGIRKANVSESLMKCRKPICDIETGAYALSWDESGGCPFTGRSVSGMKATRAWSAAAAWNVGRQVPIPPPAGFGVVRGRALSSRNCEVLSTDAGRAGGPVRSSEEAPVMGVERRGRTIEGCLFDQPEFLEGFGWASQCCKRSRSIFRSGKCGRRIGESRPTRVHREWMGRPSRRSRRTLSLIHISEPTRRTPISYAVF